MKFYNFLAGFMSKVKNLSSEQISANLELIYKAKENSSASQSNGEDYKNVSQQESMKIPVAASNQEATSITSELLKGVMWGDKEVYNNTISAVMGDEPTDEDKKEDETNISA